jgi:hypothetical protein
MKRTTLNQIVDAVAFVGFLLLTTTGVLLRYQLPPGSGRLHGVGMGTRAAERPVSLLWGLSRHEWGNVHFWVGVGLMVALALHIVLHWKWVVCVMRGRPREESGVRFGLGVAGLVAAVCLAAAPLFGPKVEVPRAELRPDAAAEHGDGEEHGTQEIRGSMTLREIEQATGVPASDILRHLGLPEDTPLGERAGRLVRQQGTDLREVRRFVRQYEREQKRAHSGD